MRIILLVTIIFSLMISCSQHQDNLLLKDLGYAQDDIVLIINADDCGMHKDVTDASIDLIDSGFIKSTSVMVPCPDYDRAVSLLKEKDISAGIHITLTNEWQSDYGWSTTLNSKEVPSLINNDGYLWPDNKSLYENADANDVKSEVRNQVESAYNDGLKITHIDAHMYSYMYNPEYTGAVFEVALEYGLPILMTNINKDELNQMGVLDKLEDELKLIIPDTYTSLYLGVEQHIMRKKYIDYVNQLKPGVHVLAIHPSYESDSIKHELKDYRLRNNDYILWSSEELLEAVNSSNIKIIGFSELKKLQQERWNDEFKEKMKITN